MEREGLLYQDHAHFKTGDFGPETVDAKWLTLSLITGPIPRAGISGWMPQMTSGLRNETMIYATRD
jgi:hypothetical protein